VFPKPTATGHLISWQRRHSHTQQPTRQNNNALQCHDYSHRNAKHGRLISGKNKNGGTEDDTWTAWKGELSQLQERGEKLPKNWELEDGLHDYKNRLLIPSNEELVTEMAKGCHDSKGDRHFRQEKMLMLVTRNFHWEKLTEWIND